MALSRFIVSLLAEPNVKDWNLGMLNANDQQLQR